MFLVSLVVVLVTVACVVEEVVLVVLVVGALLKAPSEQTQQTSVADSPFHIKLEAVSQY